MARLSTRREPVARDRSDRDRGAALVVAVAFMVMIGAMAAGLTSMITSGVGNRVQLQQIRDRQYAADGAVEEAIASTRTAIAGGQLACGAVTSRTTELNGVRIRVDASATCVAIAGADRLPVRQFVGRYDACVDLGTPCAPDAVVVEALVGFPTDAAGTLLPASVRSWSVLR